MYLTKSHNHVVVLVDINLTPIYGYPMNIKIKDVESYINQFSPEKQSILTSIRDVIIKASPHAIESISYGISAYKLSNKPLIYFAAFQHHIGVYATPSGHAEFKDELSQYKQGKGSVQFPLDKPIPYELISRITVHKTQEILKS